MAEEFDFHPMWESLGMNLADHDMLLGAVGQMYGDMFLTQNNRPKSTSYLDFVATNIHSGRIKEMLDKKEAGEATKIVGSFCVYVPEEIVLACDGIPVGLCSGADWATDKVEEHLPRNTCPLICLKRANGALRPLPAHLPDTRQLNRATTACSSA